MILLTAEPGPCFTRGGRTMSDATRTEMSRRRLLEAAGTAAVAAVAAATAAPPLRAATAPTQQVAFNASFTVPTSAVDVMAIPINPPIASVRLNLTGTADLL